MTEHLKLLLPDILILSLDEDLIRIFYLEKEKEEF